MAKHSLVSLLDHKDATALRCCGMHDPVVRRALAVEQDKELEALSSCLELPERSVGGATMAPDPVPQHDGDVPRNTTDEDESDGASERGRNPPRWRRNGRDETQQNNMHGVP